MEKPNLDLGEDVFDSEGIEEEARTATLKKVKKVPISLTLDQTTAAALQAMMMKTGRSASWCARQAVLTSTPGERELDPLETRTSICIAAWKGLTGARIRHGLMVDTRLPEPQTLSKRYNITVYVPREWLKRARETRIRTGVAIGNQIREALLRPLQVPLPTPPTYYARSNLRLTTREEQMWRMQALSSGASSLQFFVLQRILQAPMPGT